MTTSSRSKISPGILVLVIFPSSTRANDEEEQEIRGEEAEEEAEEATTRQRNLAEE